MFTPMTLQWTGTAAIAIYSALASSAVAAGGAYYQGEEQKKEDKKTRDLQTRLSEEASANEKAIFDASAETKEASYTFGTNNQEPIGQFDDFISKKSKANTPKKLGGLSGGSGLGFGV